MKVIVGARDAWPTPAVASMILSLMVSTDEDFAIRAPAGAPGMSSMVEEMVRAIGQVIDRPVIIQRPLDSDGSGRNWRRDSRLVADATEVIAFYAADGDSGGTEHVVTVALRAGKPVVAYGFDNEGDIIELGSDDGLVQSMAEYGGNWYGTDR